MNWYEKLNKYFPVEEMKSRKHMELLLQEKGDVYYKDESDKHVLMYAEFDTFIFIDYLWVSAETRGQGTGHQLIEKLKKKNKPIIWKLNPSIMMIPILRKDCIFIAKKVLHTHNR